MATTFARTVWIASDFHGAPLGTASNPFDGSTADKFDTLMRGFEAGTRIRLLDGIFETSGSANFNLDRGWFVKDGWQIIGNGPERTTIKKVFFPPGAVGAGHAALQMQYTSAGGALVSGLGIDENWQGDPGDNYCTSAVHLYGDNCSIRNVWAKNGFGNRLNNREAFTFLIAASFDGKEWANNHGGVIEDCRASDFRGDYGIAICPAGGADGAGSMDCYVRRNVVTGYNATAAFGVGGSIFEDNVSTLCSCDYYSELGSKAKIINARMGPTTGINVHLYPVAGSISEIEIEGCDIQCTKLGIGIAKIDGGAACSKISVRSNRFTGTGEAINAYNVDGLEIQDNLVSEKMISRILNCTNVISKGNKISGFPVGLEDS